MKCVKVIGGVDACTVAFVSCNCMCPDKAQAHMNEFVLMSEVCAGSKNTHK